MTTCSLHDFRRELLADPSYDETLEPEGLAAKFVARFRVSRRPSLEELERLMHRARFGMVEARAMDAALRGAHFAVSGSSYLICCRKGLWRGAAEHTVFHEAFEIVSETLLEMQGLPPAPRAEATCRSADRFAAAVLMQPEVFAARARSRGLDVIALHREFGRSFASVSRCAWPRSWTTRRSWPSSTRPDPVGAAGTGRGGGPTDRCARRWSVSRKIGHRSRRATGDMARKTHQGHRRRRAVRATRAPRAAVVGLQIRPTASRDGSLGCARPMQMQRTLVVGRGSQPRRIARGGVSVRVSDRPRWTERSTSPVARPMPPDSACTFPVAWNGTRSTAESRGAGALSVREGVDQILAESDARRSDEVIIAAIRHVSNHQPSSRVGRVAEQILKDRQRLGCYLARNFVRQEKHQFRSHGGSVDCSQQPVDVERVFVELVPAGAVGFLDTFPQLVNLGHQQGCRSRHL